MGACGHFVGKCDCGGETRVQTKIFLDVACVGDNVAKHFEQHQIKEKSFRLKLKEGCNHCWNILVATIENGIFTKLETIIPNEDGQLKDFDYEEGYFGAIKKRGEREACPVCDGKGMLKPNIECCFCGGKGTWE